MALFKLGSISHIHKLHQEGHATFLDMSLWDIEYGKQRFIFNKVERTKSVGLVNLYPKVTNIISGCGSVIMLVTGYTGYSNRVLNRAFMLFRGIKWLVQKLMMLALAVCMYRTGYKKRIWSNLK